MFPPTPPSLSEADFSWATTVMMIAAVVASFIFQARSFIAGSGCALVAVAIYFGGMRLVRWLWHINPYMRTVLFRSREYPLYIPAHASLRVSEKKRIAMRARIARARFRR